MVKQYQVKNVTSLTNVILSEYEINSKEKECTSAVVFSKTVDSILTIGSDREGEKNGASGERKVLYILLLYQVVGEQNMIFTVFDD